MTQPPTVACKIEARLEYVHVAYTTLHVFALICMLSRCLVTDFLHRSSVGSLLRVRCWLGGDDLCTHSPFFFLPFPGRSVSTPIKCQKSMDVCEWFTNLLFLLLLLLFLPWPWHSSWPSWTAWQTPSASPAPSSPRSRSPPPVCGTVLPTGRHTLSQVRLVWMVCEQHACVSV